MEERGACFAQEVEDETKVQEAPKLEVRSYMLEERWSEVVEMVVKLIPRATKRAVALMLQSACTPRLEHVMCRYAQQFLTLVSPLLEAHARPAEMARLMLLSYTPGASELATLHIISSAEFMQSQDLHVRNSARAEFDRLQEDHAFGYLPPWSEFEDGTRIFAELMAKEAADGEMTTMRTRLRQATGIYSHVMHRSQVF